MSEIIEIRVCKKCGIEKPLNLFVPNKGCCFGRTHTCTECNKKKFGKEYYNKLYSKPKIAVDKKICQKCGEEKAISEFHKKHQNKDGYANICANCQAQYISEYKKTLNGSVAYKKGREKYEDSHKEYYAEYKKEYRKTDKYKEKARQSHYIYYQKNKQKINEQTYASRKKREQEDPSVMMAKIARSRIASATRRGKFGLKTQEIVGCDFNYFKDYIESKFEEGMNWQTQGQFGWHADHILPVSSFDLSDIDQLKKCFNYSNYQPLWWWDNLSKGAKIIIAA